MIKILKTIGFTTLMISGWLILGIGIGLIVASIVGIIYSGFELILP